VPPNPFVNLTLQDAAQKLPKAHEHAEEIRDFMRGDHWRAGQAWIGQLPTDLAQRATMAAGFVSENVIEEILTRHVGGVLGREPRWGLVQRSERRIAAPRLAQRTTTPTAPIASPGERITADINRVEQDGRIAEIEEDLTSWWDERNIVQLLQKAMGRTLAEGRCTLRIFIPPGLRDEQGQIPQAATLADALEYIHVDIPPHDDAGVYLDPRTRLQLGIYT
jgi:hypothetical protein